MRPLRRFYRPPTIHHPLALFVIALCVLPACARLRPAQPAPPAFGPLEVVGSYLLPEVPSGSSNDAIAELSGAWDQDAAGKLLIVSDRRDRPGLFTMRVEVAPEVRLVPESFAAVESPFVPRTLDLEGIAPAPDGHLFLSSEGEDVNPERPVSGIFEYMRDGTFVRKLRVPGAYSGMRTNAGFEGLTVSPDRRQLFAATEGSLRQDGPAATFDAGSVNRILVYDMDKGEKPREYAYRTEPVPRLPDQKTATGDNGISEILAVGRDDVLVLERAYVSEIGTGARSANAIRIFRVHLGAEGLVTGLWSIGEATKPSVLAKTLVLDLATIAPQLHPRLKNLENFEAMSFGPMLPDGRRTLLLISDNNCSDSQVTALVCTCGVKSQNPNPKSQIERPKPKAQNREPSVNRSAALVALGILGSRIAGFVRQRAFAHYFGQSDAADAFMAAFRIPNFLQNLFGEGALSASFIPVYASLLANKDEREARRVAGAVAALLGLTTATLVLIGVLATPLLIDLIAPGFHGDKRALTITLVRILFPGSGLLAMSAWCLGILNSHRRFLLSYSAPILWNLAMIGALLVFGARETLPRLAQWLAWGSVVGSALQFGVQLPVVARLVPGLRLSLATASENVRAVIRNFMPVFVSRGVVQISAYVDALLASLLPTGSVTALANAQLLYTLPVALFGMSVSAAELPEMSGVAGVAQSDALRARLNNGLRQIAYFVIPSAVAFLALGDVIAAALLQTGRFTHTDAVFVWGVLAGSAVGLLASTLGRLYSSTFYAMKDTRTPLRFAVIRVALTTVLGYVSALWVPPALGIAAEWGTAGLTASAGVSGWVEFVLLRRTLNHRLAASTGLPASLVVRLWASAIVAAAIAWAIKIAVPIDEPILVAIVVLIPYGLAYLGMTVLVGIEEAHGALARANAIIRRG